MVDVLYGTVTPSGRLPITIPNKDNEVGFTEQQYPGTKTNATDGHLRSVYSEQLLVGYRWYVLSLYPSLSPPPLSLSPSLSILESMVTLYKCARSNMMSCAATCTL